MRSLLPKAGWMLSGVLALYVLSALAGVVTGGPLDPPGAPAPSMKTLADIAPSWHQVLDSENGDPVGCNSTRFTCVLNDEAVLDNETGLLWERTVSGGNTQWLDAVRSCSDSKTGDRYAWRLPAIEELKSLRDTSLDGVPDAWPFEVDITREYWSATSVHGQPGSAYTTDFTDLGETGSAPKTDVLGTWCVRGGYGYDGLPTLRTALDDIAPSWSRTLDDSNGGFGGCNSTRFACVLGEAAVLDNETGLVWQRNANAGFAGDWAAGLAECRNSTLGDRGGWRLPTIEELTTLNSASAKAVQNPPFSGSETSVWSSSTVPGSPTDAFIVTVGFANPQTVAKTDAVATRGVFCVRAPQSSQNP